MTMFRLNRNRRGLIGLLTGMFDKHVGLEDPIVQPQAPNSIAHL